MDQHLKILQIISGLDVNGALEHCRLLSRELVRQGHEVTIACRRRSWLWRHVDGLPVRMVECEMNRWPLGSLLDMARWVTKERFDVLHTHMSRAHLYGILLRQFSGVPVVATSHTQYFQPHWYFNDYVIANSDSTLRHQRRFNRLPESRSGRIYCFVDLERFSRPDVHWRTGVRNQWHIRPGEKVLGIIGDVVPIKGHIHLFRALPELVRRHPELRVVLTGRFHRREACTKALRRFQLAHHLERRVRWIGRRDNMHMILSGMDLVVVPSLVESMGMVAAEAMAAGKPVIAARTGGLPELVIDRHSGLLVPPRDPASLAEAIGGILDRPEEGERMGCNGAGWIRANLDPGTLTRQVIGAYYTAIHSPVLAGDMDLSRGNRAA